MRTLRSFAGPWPRTTLLILTLVLPISTTGCARRFVVIDGEETITVKKSTLDRLYNDNEILLRALEECRQEK